MNDIPFPPGFADDSSKMSVLREIAGSTEHVTTRLSEIRETLEGLLCGLRNSLPTPIEEPPKRVDCGMLGDLETSHLDQCLELTKIEAMLSELQSLIG